MLNSIAACNAVIELSIRFLNLLRLEEPLLTVEVYYRATSMLVVRRCYKYSRVATCCQEVFMHSCYDRTAKGRSYGRKRLVSDRFLVTEENGSPLWPVISEASFDLLVVGMQVKKSIFTFGIALHEPGQIPSSNVRDRILNDFSCPISRNPQAYSLQDISQMAHLWIIWTSFD